VFARSRPDRHGTLAGDLVIQGRGDPSFAARFHDGDYGKSLEALAAAIADAGIRRIQGDLVGDERYFTGPPFGTGWAWEDLQYYFGAEVSALSVDDNTVDLFLSAGAHPGDPCRVITGPRTSFLQFVNRTVTGASGTPARIRIERPLGEATVKLTGALPLGETNYVEAVTVPRPARWFLARLQEALTQHHVSIRGKLRVPEAEEMRQRIDYSRLQELARVDSRPMAELVERMMKQSQNLYAQLLLLQVGAQSAGMDSASTEAAGLKALKRFVERAGIAPAEVSLEEGAGLSHGSAVTPNAIVTLLRHMVRHREAAAFLAALPMAGADGSLRRRFSQAPAAGNLRAKPGALHSVSALSGYVATAGGQRLAFSILLNQYQPPEEGLAPSAEVDHLVTLLARFSGRFP
jgi:D-alanyl-D-alanine carboxypeptidase/D-alanyl-D-alanine-endopeptidase (penicillin-binding protein 4)